LAAVSSSGPTSRGTLAATHGAYGLAAAVANAASSGTSTTGACPWATTTSATIVPARTRSLAIMTARRSKRSPSSPATGPSSTMGSTRAAVVAPSHAGEWVRSKT